MAIAIPAWLTAVAVVLGGGWFFFVGDSPASKPQKVLIVQAVNDDEDAFPVSSFDEALKHGGHVTIRFTDIRDAHPEIENFSPSKDGSYLTHGALVNYITSHGWRYHSLELTGMIVFVR